MCSSLSLLCWVQAPLLRQLCETGSMELMWPCSQVLTCLLLISVWWLPVKSVFCNLTRDISTVLCISHCGQMSFSWISKACTSFSISKNSFTFKFKTSRLQYCSLYWPSDSDLSMCIFLALWTDLKGKIQQGQEVSWCFYTFIWLGTEFLFSTGHSAFPVVFGNALLTVPKSGSPPHLLKAVLLLMIALGAWASQNRPLFRHLRKIWDNVV